MRILAFAASLVLLAGCGSGPDRAASDVSQDAGSVSPASVEGDRYGEPITLSEVTPVSTILDAPETWVGKRVLVRGMIVAVCEKRGCWMDIASDREFEKIQIKVDDGVIVFPLSAKGKDALVEGVVERLDLTAEEALAEAKRKAEEHGEDFDPSAVTGPQTIFRIRGVGAIVSS